MSTNTSPGRDTYAAFRSIKNPSSRRDSFVPSNGRGRRAPIWEPTSTLIGHLVSTTAVFVSLFTLTWLGSVVFSYLHAAHRFSQEALDLFVSVEITLLYLDAVICAVALLFGIARYFRTLLEHF